MKTPARAGLVLAIVWCHEIIAAETQPASPPNIVYILCDDLGYGDVKCLNPEGKIATPNMDRLAAAGMIFTDAHSSSAVCTPTRYGIITGRYNWRSRLKQGVLGGMSPRLIEPGRLTVPALLKQHGYATASIGKWHLGMDWTLKTGEKGFGDEIEKGEDGWRVDFTKPTRNGPNSVGFDYYFGISASLDMVPYTFIENDHVTALPTEDKEFPLMLGRGGGMTRKGPAAAGFDAADVLPTLTRKAVEYVSQRAADAKAGKPFFLYFPLNAPHTPIVPTAQWQGKSGLNPYADFVMQTDWSIGEVMRAIDQHGLGQNTLFIVTSDNGCSPQAKFDELLAKGHNPSYILRGHKADIFDGGHRIPFIVRWPAKVRPGSTSDQLICLNDLMATCADILAVKLPGNAGEDSVSILPALVGKADKPLREAVVHHSINGSFSIRQSHWKLELCPDSGGWSVPRPGSPAARDLPAIQLYDLSTDIGEKNNLSDKHAELVDRLTKLLQKYVADGRSTPGTPQQNTTEVNIWRSRAVAVPSQRPNIVFIQADDLGYGDLGCYGQQKIKTPHVDRLTAEGMRFTSYYAGSTVCAPSRSVLLTGQHTGHTRVRGNAGRGNPLAQSLRPEDVTVAEVLKQAGYATGHTGKWGLGDEGPAAIGMPTRQGFDFFFGYLNQHHAHNYYPPFLIRGESRVSLPNEVKPIGADGGGVATEKIAYSPDMVLDEALQFIDSKRDRPFFLYFSPTLPHANNEATRELGDGTEVPDYGVYEHETWTKQNKGHAAMITYLDTQVGRILERLRALGLDERTIVFFTSDNGPHKEAGNDPDFFNASGGLRGLKRSLTDGGIRVPMIVRWPGRIPAGSVTDHAAYHGDLMATAVELAGTKPPEKLDSVSYLPTLLGRSQEQKQHTYLYWEFYEGGSAQAVRIGQWKAIRKPMLTGPIELFDLTTDRSETRDVAAQYPDVVARVKAAMDEAHVPSPDWPVSGATSAIMNINQSTAQGAAMPLLDHFRPPLSQRRHWDSFHGAWAEAIAINLNQSLLPERFVAEARVKLGGQVEIDVGTFAQDVAGPSSESGGVALWAPAKPAATAALDFQDLDVFEVQVLSEEEGPRLVAAIELVSPANKDRPANRRMFAVKCASYLHGGVSVIIVDVVTERSGNLHTELLELLQVQLSTPGLGVHDLYATAHRTVPTPQGLHLESWAELLTLGGSLPTLPLWLEPDFCLPLDLEATYQAACVARRIAS